MRARGKTPDHRVNTVKSPHPKRLKKALKVQEQAKQAGILKVATPEGRLARKLSFRENPKVTVIEAENKRPSSQRDIRVREPKTDKPDEQVMASTFIDPLEVLCRSFIDTRSDLVTQDAHSDSSTEAEACAASV